MKKFQYLVVGLLMLSSCYNTHNSSEFPEPDRLIGQDKLVLILVDVEITESALRQKQTTGHELGNAREAYYNAIFKQHEVCKEQFDSSMLFYKQNLEVMDDIYEEVITRLSLMESEAQLE